MNIVFLIFAIVSLLLAAEFYYFNLGALSLGLLVLGLLALAFGILKMRSSNKGDSGSSAG